jgi:hypothetical protein
MCRELETVKKEEAKLKTELAQVNMPARSIVSNVLYAQESTCAVQIYCIFEKKDRFRSLKVQNIIHISSLKSNLHTNIVVIIVTIS